MNLYRDDDSLSVNRKDISLVTAGGYHVLEIQQKHMWKSLSDDDDSLSVNRKKISLVTAGGSLIDH